MDDFENIRAQGLSLGLESEALAKFVLQQQAMLRDERANEREERAKERDREERAKERELEHELELARINARKDKVALPELSNLPSLPVYRDGEDISSYFIRFERIAKLLNIDESTYAVRLGSLLTGRAIEIYTSLSPDITANYDSLKKGLLRGFCKTPDGYRQEFRNAKIKQGETYEQFSISLVRLFDHWVESCHVQHTYDDLKTFIVLDQLKSSVSPELRIFLKEHNVTDLAEATELADNWATAHGAYPKSNSRPGLDKGKKIVPTKVNATDSDSENQRFRPKCHGCGEIGHIRPKCPKNPRAFQKVQCVNFSSENSNKEFYVSGTINGSWVSTILRDTGCSCVVVSEEALPDVDTVGCERVKLADYLGREDSFPLVKCFIRCPYYVGWVMAVRAPIKFCSVLVGNVPGAKDPGCPVEVKSDKLYHNERELEDVKAVQTRASKTKRVHPLVLPKVHALNLSPIQFSELQEQCETLVVIRGKVELGETETARDGSKYRFEKINNLIYRTCVHSKVRDRIGHKSLVIPAECRKIVLSVAHESPLAGHFSHRKTESRVRDQFYWPAMSSDIRDYCKSCDKCQRMSQKGRLRPVPLKPMPIQTEPFSRVAIDLVGPLSPPSSEGHRFILTLVDFATGFPEALPLKEIDSISVAEALILIFSRVGIPREILSDRGAQFTSSLMAELHKLLGVKPLFTTPYHPSCNGRVERLHSTLKACLRKLCSDKPKEWHRYLVPTMFALREIPSDRTGFSAFELLYGRAVRGPLSVLRDLWEDSEVPTDERSTFQYVIDLREKLEDCAKIAAQNAEVSSARYRSYFDVKSQNRHFKPGDEVLVLLPDKTSKLLMAWRGPYSVLERRNQVDYLIDENGNPKLYHVNLLKKYTRRSQMVQAQLLDEEFVLPDVLEPLQTVHQCVIEDDEVGMELPLTPDGGSTAAVLGSEGNGLHVSPNLNQAQKDDVSKLALSYNDVFSKSPGCTDLIKHDICLSSTEKIRAKSYPIPIHLQSYFEEEVDNLYEEGIVRLSSSPYCSPVVMVRKSDGSYRMAIDYRALNAVTAFHAEPVCRVEEELYKFSGASHFSELDLCKAYYQIPLTEEAMPLTAFPTHRGLMEFTRMPFGLVTACATYIRLMRLVLSGLSNVSFYFDNIFIYSNSWKDHTEYVTAVLDRLRTHKLTAKPSKCRIGFTSIQYLGYIIDGKNLKPQHDKIEALISIPIPRTKKALRSFLGMVSFYRMFIPHVSDLTGPLSDLLRKGVSEPLPWNEAVQANFHQLKVALTTEPILKLPDVNLPFVLRTDASDRGLGAVLLQYGNDVPFPVAYASRKLQDRERRYSTVERECLAIIFGIQRFEYYLLGKEFVLEVDHKPLVYMNTKRSGNNRLVRWSLSLQPFRFRIVHIAGKDNIGADALSRC